MTEYIWPLSRNFLGDLHPDRFDVLEYIAHIPAEELRWIYDDLIGQLSSRDVGKACYVTISNDFGYNVVFRYAGHNFGKVRGRTGNAPF